MYNSRAWLNSKDSSFRATSVCYSGPSTRSKKGKETFISIADCHTSVYLHEGLLEVDGRKAFIKKLEVLRKEIKLFSKYLNKRHK